MHSYYHTMVTMVTSQYRAFGHFEKPLFIELCKHVDTKFVPSGAILFRPGQVDDSIYVVRNGRLKVCIVEQVRKILQNLHTCISTYLKFLFLLLSFIPPYFLTLPSFLPTPPAEHLSSPGSLQKGDIYTHAYHGFPSTIVDPQKTPPVIHPAVLEAKKRGVYFDIGHGQGSFSWTVAEVCAEQGFWPDAISTDLHSGNIHGPAYDLPTVMSRFLHLGMPLYDVVRAVTVTPATVIRKEHLIGSLSSGM